MTPRERLVTVRENSPKEEVLALLHKHASRSAGDRRRLRVEGHDHRQGLPEGHRVPAGLQDERGALRVGAAVGTSPDTLDRVAALREAGVDVIVVDTRTAIRVA